MLIPSLPLGWGDLAFFLAVCWNSWLLKFGEGGTWVVCTWSKGESVREDAVGWVPSDYAGTVVTAPVGHAWVRSSSSQVSAIWRSGFTDHLKHREGLSTVPPEAEALNLEAPPFGSCIFADTVLTRAAVTASARQAGVSRTQAPAPRVPPLASLGRPVPSPGSGSRGAHGASPGLPEVGGTLAPRLFVNSLRATSSLWRASKAVSWWSF